LIKDQKAYFDPSGEIWARIDSSGGRPPTGLVCIILLDEWPPIAIPEKVIEFYPKEVDDSGPEYAPQYPDTKWRLLHRGDHRTGYVLNASDDPNVLIQVLHGDTRPPGHPINLITGQYAYFDQSGEIWARAGSNDGKPNTGRVCIFMVEKWPS
jgi:hypothetical protein